MRSDARLGAVLAIAVAASIVACGAPRRAPPEIRSSGAELGHATAPCGGCHAREEEAWRASLHRQSFTDPDFQAAYRDEPLAFCAGCHAPVPGDHASGVGCTSCHRDASEHQASAGGIPAHRPGAEACASCHEFASPLSGAFLQSTVSEHAASSEHRVSCVDCHMRGGDHRFSVSRDPSLLGRALDVHGVRRSDAGVTVLLAKRGVGHRFPTGDVFRRLFVRAWVEGADGAILGVAERTLQRDWNAHRAGAREEPNDSRLGDTPLEVLVPLPREVAASRVRLQVDYQRGAVARAGSLALFASLPIADFTAAVPAPAPASALREISVEDTVTHW